MDTQQPHRIFSDQELRAAYRRRDGSSLSGVVPPRPKERYIQLTVEEAKRLETSSPEERAAWLAKLSPADRVARYLGASMRKRRGRRAATAGAAE